MSYFINALISLVISTAMAIIVHNTTELPPQSKIIAHQIVTEYLDAHQINMEYGSVRLRDSSEKQCGITLGVDRDYAGIRVFNGKDIGYLWASKDRGLERNP